MFVVIEGIDGCGKGTQAELVVGYVRETFGGKCAHFKYPDRTTPIGRIIDDWLHGYVALGRWGKDEVFVPARDDVSLLALQGLMLANKLEVTRKLLYSFERGHVVADRYTPSGVCYGAADGLDFQYLYENHHVPLFQPDLYVLLDCTVEDSFRRRPRRAEAYEDSRSRLRDARANYLEMAEMERGAWLVLDAAAPRAELANKVRDAVDELYERGL
jgi:dTMP kinase